MSKIISAYSGYTASQIKTRASFPPQVNMTVNGSNVECVSLKTAGIKSVLSEATNKRSLLNKSSNINPYSHFCPSWWQLSAGSIISSQDFAGYKSGDFAGYNHNALAPSKSNFVTAANIPSGGGNVTVTSNIDVGEINWRTKVLFANIDAVEMVVKQGASILGSQEIAYTDTTQQTGFNFSQDVYMSGAGTLTVNFFFNEDGENVAPIPNISSHNISVGVVYPAEIGTIDLDSTLKAANPTWNLVYTSASINQTSDTYSIYGLAIDNNSDGEGDITRFNMELFRRVNGGKWGSVMAGINITSSGINIINDAIGQDVGNGDVIDFELRDG